MADSDDGVEITILTIKPAFVCRIPPLQTADGHRAESWDRKPIWDGRLRIVSRDNKLFILLEHTRGDEAGELFASCPIQADPKLPPSVEYVVDSSRYFVLRIEGDKGKKAYLGLFFNSREEAFDFKAGLQHEQNSRSEQEKAKAYMDSQPQRDLSLPSGGSIKISLKSKVVTKKEENDDSKEKKSKPIAALAMPSHLTKKKTDHSTKSLKSKSEDPFTDEFNSMKVTSGDKTDDDFNWTEFESAPSKQTTSSSEFDPFA